MQTKTLPSLRYIRFLMTKNYSNNLFQKYNMRGFCGINHTQGYDTVTLMVMGCFSSETAVFLLMETSDNGCSNRTTLSKNFLSRKN